MRRNLSAVLVAIAVVPAVAAGVVAGIVVAVAADRLRAAFAGALDWEADGDE